MFIFYRCALYLLRFLVAVVVILMYIGSGVAIYFTVDWITQCPSVENRDDVDEGGYHTTHTHYSIHHVIKTCCVSS